MADLEPVIAEWNERMDGIWVGAKFFEVIDCSSHTSFASTVIKPPTGEAEQDDTSFVLDFASYSINDGQTFEAVMSGLGAWAAHESENGLQNHTYMMFPIFGEADDDYAFKLVNGHNNHTTLGADWASEE